MRSLTLLAVLLFSATASAEDWQPTPQQHKAIRALSAYDAGPSCADLDQMLEQPVADLEAIVANVRMPQWAPMRAANCLLDRHAEAALPTIRTWVEDEELEGLGALVVVRLDRLPEAVAVDLGTRALNGPVAERARAKLALDSRPVVRALAK